MPRPVVQYLFGSISESLHGGVVVPPTPGDPAGCLALECVRQRLTGVGSLGCWRWGAPIKVDRLWLGGSVTGPIRLPGLPSSSSPPCTCLRERVSHFLARVPRSFLCSIRLPGLPSSSSPPCTCVSHLLAIVPRSFLSSIITPPLT